MPVSFRLNIANSVPQEGTGSVIRRTGLFGGDPAKSQRQQRFQTAARHAGRQIEPTLQPHL